MGQAALSPELKCFWHDDAPGQIAAIRIAANHGVGLPMRETRSALVLVIS